MTEERLAKHGKEILVWARNSLQHRRNEISDAMNAGRKRFEKRTSTVAPYADAALYLAGIYERIVDEYDTAIARLDEAMSTERWLDRVQGR